MSVEAKQYSQISTSEKLQKIASWLLEKKALNLLALDLSSDNSVVEASIIITANSIRHAQGLSDFLLEECRNNKLEFLRMEGYAVGMWILLDLNDIAIHIFQRENRDIYGLESLWPNAIMVMDERENKTTL